jgi:hypothetical protein
VSIVKPTRDDILVWWQAAHFNLSPEQQIRFKEDPLIAKLQELHCEAVREVILLNRLQKLKDIQTVAISLQAAKWPNVAENATIKWKQKPERRIQPILRRSSTRDAATSRGPESFREHGMINPPPSEKLKVDRSKLPKCSICSQPIVGTMCACW